MMTSDRPHPITSPALTPATREEIESYEDGVRAELTYAPTETGRCPKCGSPVTRNDLMVWCLTDCGWSVKL